MKKSLLFLVFFSSLSMAQTSTGPGIKSEPPTAAPQVMDEQGEKFFNTPGMAHTPELPEYEEERTDIKGKRGKRAVKSGEMDLSKEEIQKKQKGE